MKEPYQVRYGGLMRCCLETLTEAMAAAPAPPKEGDEVACLYCHNPMIFRDGMWEWNREKAKPLDGEEEVEQ